MVLTTEDNWLEETANVEGNDVHAELNAIKWANDEKGKVIVERKKEAKRDRRVAGIGASLPPLFVLGKEDCTAVYELLLNTFGLLAFL